MTQQEASQTIYPQLTAESFQNPAFENDDEDELNEVAIAPTNIDLTTHTVRVTRPVQPTDFTLQRPLQTEKELLDLALR